MPVLSCRAVVRRFAVATVAGVLAATPLVPSPAAQASPGHPSRCSAPSIDQRGDRSALTVHVVLPVSGCATRGHRMFTLSATVARYDAGEERRSVLGREERCGPFRSADDVDAGDEAPRSTCELDATSIHDEVDDHTRYDIAVTFPGAAAERTETLTIFCTDEGDTVICRPERSN